MFNEIMREKGKGFVRYFSEESGMESIVTFPNDSSEYAAAKSGELIVAKDELGMFGYISGDGGEEYSADSKEGLDICWNADDWNMGESPF